MGSPNAKKYTEGGHGLACLVIVKSESYNNKQPPTHTSAQSSSNWENPLLFAEL